LWPGSFLSSLLLLLLPLWLWLWLTLLLLGLTLLWRGSGLGSWRLGLRMGLERQDLCFQRLEFLLHLDHLRSHVCLDIKHLAKDMDQRLLVPLGEDFTWRSGRAVLEGFT